MKKLVSYIILFLILLSIWTLLTLPFSMPELVAGSLITIIILFLIHKTIEPLFNVALSYKTFLYAIPFGAVFFWELLKSNFDVAFRVIDPKLPINPGIVKVKTSLTSSVGRLVLANAITLTPGTLTVETDGEDFYIHWIDVSTSDIEASTAKIVAKFERYLEVMFG